MREAISGISAEEGAPSGSRARMSGPETGTALGATAGPTTSLAAPAASSAAASRMTSMAPAPPSIPTFQGPVASHSPPAVRAGNPATGFAPGTILNFEITQ